MSLRLRQPQIGSSGLCEVRLPLRFNRQVGAPAGCDPGGLGKLNHFASGGTRPAPRAPARSRRAGRRTRRSGPRASFGRRTRHGPRRPGQATGADVLVAFANHPLAHLGHVGLLRQVFNWYVLPERPAVPLGPGPCKSRQKRLKTMGHEIACDFTRLIRRFPLEGSLSFGVAHSAPRTCLDFAVGSAPRRAGPRTGVAA